MPGPSSARQQFHGIMGFDSLIHYFMPADSPSSIVADSQCGPVPSPCVSLCQIDPGSGWCHGCLRTLDEIVAWGSADEASKRAVWALIRQREQLIDFE